MEKWNNELVPGSDIDLDEASYEKARKIIVLLFWITLVFWITVIIGGIGLIAWVFN